MELLSSARIGRLIYNSRYGPVALPSEYKVQTDPGAREGWLVLVRGTAHHLDTAAEQASVASLGLSPGSRANPGITSGSIPPVSEASDSAEHDAQRRYDFLPVPVLPAARGC
jgi:hypothetical protein